MAGHAKWTITAVSLGLIVFLAWTQQHWTVEGDASRRFPWVLLNVPISIAHLAARYAAPLGLLWSVVMLMKEWPSGVRPGRRSGTGAARQHQSGGQDHHDSPSAGSLGAELRERTANAQSKLAEAAARNRTLQEAEDAERRPAVLAAMRDAMREFIERYASEVPSRVREAASRGENTLNVPFPSYSASYLEDVMRDVFGPSWTSEASRILGHDVLRSMAMDTFNELAARIRRLGIECTVGDFESRDTDYEVYHWWGIRMRW